MVEFLLRKPPGRRTRQRANPALVGYGCAQRRKFGIVNLSYACLVNLDGDYSPSQADVFRDSIGQSPGYRPSPELHRVPMIVVVVPKCLQRHSAVIVSDKRI